MEFPHDPPLREGVDGRQRPPCECIVIFSEVREILGPVFMGDGRGLLIMVSGTRDLGELTMVRGKSFSSSDDGTSIISGDWRPELSTVTGSYPSEQTSKISELGGWIVVTLGICVSVPTED